MSNAPRDHIEADHKVINYRCVTFVQILQVKGAIGSNNLSKHGPILYHFTFSKFVFAVQIRYIINKAPSEYLQVSLK